MNVCCQKRLGAVFLCMLFVVFVFMNITPPVRADAVVLPILGTVALAFTLLTICGVTFGSDSGALAAANSFITKANNYATIAPIWAALQAKQLAGEAISLGADALKSIFDFVFGSASEGAMGLTPNSASASTPIFPSAIPLSSLGSQVPMSYFGEPMFMLNETGTIMVIFKGSDYTDNGTEIQYNLYNGSVYFATGEYVPFDSNFRPAYLRMTRTANYVYSLPEIHMNVSSDGTVGRHYGSESAFRMPYVTPTGVRGTTPLTFFALAGYSVSSYPPITHVLPQSWIDQQRAAEATAVAYNSAWANGVLEKLADLEGQIIALPTLLNPAAGETANDVIPDWVDDVINPPWAGDVVTRDTLLDLFMPKEGFLAAEFDDMLDRFPQLADLAPLEGLRTLGERKPEFRIKLNNYFGINADQKGIDIDIWDDKRYIFKAWIRAFLIILTVIYVFNQCYKLVRSGSFTDTGTSEGKSVTAPKGGKGK